ncbi:hypothetical protein FACS1894130_01100 [Spirochaetia bacterium]|nr:hypothetical protein FACS1894130_01100 [Spirochaetia bacterium]
MAHNKTKYRLLLLVPAFCIYLFVAAQPIPVETILVPQWLSSLESNYTVYFDRSSPAGTSFGARSNGVSPESGVIETRVADVADSGETDDEADTGNPDTSNLRSFTLGNRFGYIDTAGKFVINQVKKEKLSISGDYWAEYEARPARVEVRNPRNNTVAVLEDPKGYPLFLDNRIFLINNEQHSLQAVDASGKILWNYDFAAPITDMDAAAGLVLAGFLDGTVELLDESGKRIFFFEPVGSRLAVIYGCRISRDGSWLAIISGYDNQRFLLLERSENSYKVVYHEFLSKGFRRDIHIAFIDHDRRVVFEREGGLGIYDINTRNSVQVALDGKINAIDGFGEDDMLFVITSQSGTRKELVGIRLSGEIIMEAPFRSSVVFLGRQGKRLYVGGDETLASFELNKR